jgi:hypothetical protein
LLALVLFRFAPVSYLDVPLQALSDSPFITSVSLFELLAVYVLGLFFNPEDAGRTFLRNIGKTVPDYTALHPKI